MRRPARLVLQSISLAAALLAAAGSSGSGAPSGAERRLRPERDPELRHAVLRVVNRSPDLVRLHVRGPIERLVVAPPTETYRVLLPAGRYRAGLARGARRPVLAGLVLRSGYRYTVEVDP
jgi:hypothetical protein